MAVALSHIASSAWVSGIAAVTPSVPTGTAAGDLVVITLVSKYDDAALGDAPAGWTDVSAGVSNTGSSSGNDAGNMRARAFYRVWESGDTMPSLAPTPNNVSTTKATTYRVAAGKQFGVSGTLAAGDQTASPWVLNSGINLGVTAGDLMQVDIVANGDVIVFGTLTTTTTGVTFSAATTNTVDTSTASGTDLEMRSVRYTASSGTSSGATNASQVITSGSTNTRIIGLLLRVRETTPSTYAASGTVAATSAVAGDATVIPGTVQHPASGTTAATTAAVGAIGALLAASGLVAATSTTTGDAGVAAGPQQYAASGTVAGSSGTAGAATSRLPAAGATVAVSSASGTPTSLLAASGTTVATGGATGTLTARYLAAGSAAAVSSADGTPTARLTASSTVAAVSATAGSPSVIGGPAQYPAVGTTAALSETEGTVTALYATAGAHDAQSGVSGAVDVVSGPATYPADGTIAALTMTSGAPSVLGAPEPPVVRDPRAEIALGGVATLGGDTTSAHGGAIDARAELGASRPNAIIGGSP